MEMLHNVYANCMHLLFGCYSVAALDAAVLLDGTFGNGCDQHQELTYSCLNIHFNSRSLNNYMMWVLVLHYLPYLSQEFRDTVNYFRKEMTGKLLLIVHLLQAICCSKHLSADYKYLRNMCSVLVQLIHSFLEHTFLGISEKHCDNGCLLGCILQAVCSCFSLSVDRICSRKIWKWVFVWFGDTGTIVSVWPNPSLLWAGPGMSDPTTL